MLSEKGNSTHNGLQLRMFSDEELYALHRGTLQVLANTGFIAEDQEALTLFRDAGAMVDFDRCLVKLPSFLVEEALHTAPSAIRLAGRGDKGFFLGDNAVRYCSFGEAPQIVDPYTKKIRPVLKKDEGDYAKIIDALNEHDMCWDAWVATDVPGETYNLHSFESYVNNTVKPFCTATPNGFIARATVAMAKAVAGSERLLREKPLCLAGTCPKSPLHLDAGICEAIIVLARAGIPVISMSALTSGGTGTVTLAGTMVIHNAEMLASLVLSQLAAKGAPFIYGACTSALDLRRGTATFGCPEIGMFSAAFAALTKHYRLPNVVAGFWTDSKLSDMQCGHEKTMNGLLPALAGADMIFGTGCLAAGMIGSFGQLVADDEMIAMMRRFLKGIPVTDHEMALDIIEKVGPKGNFLSEAHTVANMKQSQIYPDFMDRNTYGDWKTNGKSTFATNAEERALTILEEHKPEPLAVSLQKELTQIIEDAEKELHIK